LAWLIAQPLQCQYGPPHTQPEHGGFWTLLVIEVIGDEWRERERRNSNINSTNSSA
jgi:hypothetical protein